MSDDDLGGPWDPYYVPPRPKRLPKAKPVVRDEAYYERIREQLDDFMLTLPTVAHHVREAPLSAKHRNNPLTTRRMAKTRGPK